MSVRDNMALDRRVEELERAILVVEPKRIRTTFRVFRRGVEPACSSAAEARRLAALDPVVELVGEYPDLDVLIDAETGARIQRAANDTSFDVLAEGVEVIDVMISCYAEQLQQIMSDAPTTATTGGTRAGKTRVLVWWMFRQWLLRGHGIDEDHEAEGVGWWIREDSEKLYKHGVKWLLRLWPNVFVGKIPNETTKNPSLHLFDGSRIDFRHAHHSGSKAGTNLRSESVGIGIVVDELSAIHHEENLRELQARVALTGAPIAAAFTPTAGHWSARLAKQAPHSGGTIVVRKLTMFDNPWWKKADMWIDLLRLGAITAAELEQKILPAEDQFAAAMSVVTDPNVRRMRFGEEQSIGLTLWREWSDELVVRDGDGLRSSFRGLPNVTAAVVGGFFGTSRPKAWGGKDFNVNPNVGVVLQAFGDPARPVVLVIDEVVTVGPTLRNAEEIDKRYPGLPHFCDPTGAMYMHPARGAPSTRANATDVEEMRRAGLPCVPAAGSSKNNVRHLSRHDSVNVMHRAMKENLFFVHARCTGVLRAMTDMQSDEQGLPKKTSGVTSISDQISGYGDAVRYGVWRAYQGLLVSAASVSGGHGAPT
jgi:hypothetical protein